MEKQFINELKNIFPINEEKDKILQQKFPVLNWKDILFSWKKNSLLNRYLSLSKNFENSGFFKGMQFEYGLNNNQINPIQAFCIYKKAADSTNDCLSMYKMYSIYFQEYKKFFVKRNKILEKFYLFKCLAYSPFIVFSRRTDFFTKVDLLYEISFHLDTEDENTEKINKLLDYLLEINDKFKNSENEEINKYRFPTSQITLIKAIVLNKFARNDDDKIKSLEILSHLLLFGDNEAIYKLGCLEISKDKNLAKSFFEKMYENKYYRAYDEYAKLLYSDFNEEEKPKKILLEGIENGNFYCYIYYYDLQLYTIKTIDYYENKEILAKKLFNLLEILLCDILCGGVFSFYEYFYLRFFLIKHFNLKKEIDKKYGEDTKELINFLLDITKPEKKTFLKKNFNEDYSEAEFNFSTGILYYYGVENLVEIDYKKSYEYINKCFNLGKTKTYKRFIYSYLYKIKKHNKEKDISFLQIDDIDKNLFDFYYSSLSEQSLKELSSSFFYYIAKLYEYGIGTDKNYLIAYAYYLQASKTEPKSLGKGSIISYFRKWKTKEILEKEIFVDVENSLENLHDDDLGVGKEGKLCCICYQSNRNHIILPCKHKFCGKCVKLLEEKCPLCRGKIIIYKKLKEK